MIDEYRDLVLETEIQILNHALVDKFCLEEVKAYKFQRPELKPILDEIQDIQNNNYEPVIQALWDKHPVIYGRLKTHKHSDILKLLSVAKLGKARIYTYNKLVEHLAYVATDTRPLAAILLKIITDMKIVRGAL